MKCMSFVVFVMKLQLWKVVDWIEHGPVTQVFENPQHTVAKNDL